MRTGRLAAVAALAAVTGSVAVAEANVLVGTATEPTLWGQAMDWIVSQQRAIQTSLTDSLRSLTADGGIAATWGLIVAAGLYGILHAAGPGHGKVVLTTYLVTHGARLGRGVGMAAAAAACQGLVALVLVYGLIYLAGWLPRDTASAVDWTERASYALVTAIGAYLVWRAARAVYREVQARRQVAVTADAVVHDSHHHHDHDETCDCGHIPSASQIESANDLRTMAGVVLSIGLRPCSGAVLVLVFARALDLPWAGVAAVAAMSAGTAFAVASLAFLAVYARDRVTSLLGRDGGAWALAANGIAMTGGGVLIAVGLSLMAASFATRHPFAI